MLKKPANKAAGEKKPEAYPLGYVEDFFEPRTKLTGFFSILLDGFERGGEPLIRHRPDAGRLGRLARSRWIHPGKRHEGIP